MVKKGDAYDPKGLIYEAYRIDGITKPECRSIFLDWALNLPGTDDTRVPIQHLLSTYAEGNSDHPMTEVLREGLEQTERPRRRGGWKARRSDQT